MEFFIEKDIMNQSVVFIRIESSIAYKVKYGFSFLVRFNFVDL